LKSGLLTHLGQRGVKVSKFQDLIGQRFERWTVIKRAENSKQGRAQWLCKCKCGNERIVAGHSLKSGKSKNCGCLRKEKTTKHGLHGTRFYHTWESMKQRCENHNSNNFKKYGDRGITCTDFDKFEAFMNGKPTYYSGKKTNYEAYSEHVEKYGEKNTTIERIDNDGNYTLNNIRWATHSEQNFNKRYWNARQFKAISPSGKKLISNNQSKFARDYKLNLSSIKNVLRKSVEQYRGWRFEYV